MAKNLVIVESPAKAKTIKKFLGSNYKIEASMGHVRDLPKSQMGIEIDNDFEPKYITIRGKGELLAKLRKEVKKASKVYLATDPDREGEAISWHLLHALNLKVENTYRITFNEITKNAVQSSIKNAREIDMDLVDAQQARRILDRIVGYQISPLLWKKVKKGLSAGRVQSIALKLICDREEEINIFIPEEYWTLDAALKDQDSDDLFTAKFYGTKNGKQIPRTEEEMNEIIKSLKAEDYRVVEIKERERIKKPAAPFTTSTLQQEASKKLNFTTSKTMRVAQDLYEGVDVAGHGTLGLITYLRTDSTRISEEAHVGALEFIEAQYGKEFANPLPQTTTQKGKVQDAHEAIRPSYIEINPDSVKASLTRDQFRLYKLIWSRFVASRMAPALYHIKSIKIDNGDYRFTAALSILEFEGYLKVYQDEEVDEDSDTKENQKISKITEDTQLTGVNLDSKQHFTQPPARYSEANLVKVLEENGVGRPSTYAPTIATIQARGYVAKENKTLFPTELGEIVNDIMSKYFTEIVDVGFTAGMEQRLDQIAEGQLEWKAILRDFYPGFHEIMTRAENTLGKIELKEEVSDVLCELCGRNMVVKMGKYGKFLACPGFPECRNAKPILEKVADILCPKCGGEILFKKTKNGRRYYGCEHNPTCDFMVWNMPTAVKCKICDSMMIDKGKKLLCINQQCQNVIEKD